MRWLLLAPRQTYRAGRDCEGAAIGHSFGRVEDEIEESLLELRGFAHHVWEIRLELLQHLNVLMSQLVPHKETHFVDQFVQVYRGQVRIGRAGEVKDLFHDKLE